MFSPPPPADDAEGTPWRLRRRSGGRQLQSSLVAWIAGLPWVEEAGRVSGPLPVRRFDIRCQPLGVDVSWAVVTEVAGRPEVALQLVVPEVLCAVVAEAGWFDDVTHFSSGAYLCRVALDNRQPIEVQFVVLSVYGFMFPPPDGPRAG